MKDDKPNTQEENKTNEQLVEKREQEEKKS